MRDQDPSNPLELVVLGRRPCENCGLQVGSTSPSLNDRPFFNDFWVG